MDATFFFFFLKISDLSIQGESSKVEDQFWGILSIPLPSFLSPNIFDFLENTQKISWKQNVQIRNHKGKSTPISTQNYGDENHKEKERAAIVLLKE